MKTFLKQSAFVALFAAGLSITSCKDNNAGSDADTDNDTELLDAQDTSPVDTVVKDGDTLIDTEGTRNSNETVQEQEP